MHIIIVQIVIHMQKCISIIIYKHEIDLKLYALTFKIKILKYYKRIFLNAPTIEI